MGVDVGVGVDEVEKKDLMTASERGESGRDGDS